MQKRKEKLFIIKEKKRNQTSIFSPMKSTLFCAMFFPENKVRVFLKLSAIFRGKNEKKKREKKGNEHRTTGGKKKNKKNRTHLGNISREKESLHPILEQILVFVVL